MTPRVPANYRPYKGSGTSPHVNATSDGSTAGALTVPKDAIACVISVETNDVWVTFDGTTPSTSNGIQIKKDSPQFFPFAESIKFLTTSVASSEMNVLWLGA